MMKPMIHRNLPIIEVSEKLILDTLLADPVTSRHILSRLSDTVAVLAPQQVDDLLTRLRKQGHTPKIIRGDES